jgi:transposase
MKVTTVGIDLAKNVFQVHGVDERGKAVLRKQLRRAQVAMFFGNLPPCVIGMEACASAHYWGRTLQRYGHTVRLMASQFVKPYVKTNKNDAADAEAICEAVSRSNMRFVPIKSVEQQAILSVHRVRQGFVKARTAQANQIRGLLGEFGLVIPKGIYNVAKRVPELLEDASNELPVPFRHSAWLGLVPRQHSSGGKPTLLGMSKRGDAYLRTLLIHGARSAILAAKLKVDNTNGWLTNLLTRRHPNIAAVALANKNVRTVWALLAHGREFKADYARHRMAT